METLGEIISQAGNERHENEPGRAASLLEYVRGADTQEQQLERAQEVCDTVPDMLTYDNNGRLTGVADSSYFQAHDKEHLDFILEARTLYDEVLADEEYTVEHIVNHDERVEMLKSKHPGPGVRAARTLVLAELIVAELTRRLETGKASA